MMKEFQSESDALKWTVLFGLTGSIILMSAFSTVLKLSEHNIIEFELAFDSQKMGLILNAWDQKGLLPRVYQNLQLDFIFIAFYTLFLFSATRLAAEKLDPLAQGSWLALLSFAAGGFDFIENILLFIVLDSFREGMISGTAVLAASLAAFIKFFLAGTVIFYLASSLCYSLIQAILKKKVIRS